MTPEKKIYILSDKKVKNTINLPMINISYISQNIKFSEYDAIVFTSRNAIKSLDSYGEDWKKIPAYVIAPETAKTLKSLGGNVSYIGDSGHGNDFAQEIKEKLSGKKVLYACGKKVVSNLFEILNDSGVFCERVVVYETVCKKYEEKIILPKDSVIIFSSPSTLACFFKNISDWDESYKAVSIGKTTAQYFPNHIKPFISETTSLESCVEKALELF